MGSSGGDGCGFEPTTLAPWVEIQLNLVLFGFKASAYRIRRTNPLHFAVLHLQLQIVPSAGVSLGAGVYSRGM